jgi:penicillin-insensitive murein endopeptidase
MLLIVIAAIYAADIRAEGPADLETSKSVSMGTPIKGSLVHGVVLPKKGAGYLLTAETQRRRARFGVNELVTLVKEIAFKVNRKYPGGILRVADLSKRLGGPIDHHGSHQSGLDVDLLFYLLDEKGKSVAVEDFIPIDLHGYSTEPPMKYTFDTARNWALVETALGSQKAEVQWIFVAEHIKDLLVAYAEENGASPLVIQKARQILRQPGPKTHVDHFHVRIYCPKNDASGCTDMGPRWAWIR